MDLDCPKHHGEFLSSFPQFVHFERVTLIRSKSLTAMLSSTSAFKVPPPVFKFIKVRKSDGTIVTVKKKLRPEELEARQKTAAKFPTPFPKQMQPPPMP